MLHYVRDRLKSASQLLLLLENFKKGTHGV